MCQVPCSCPSGVMVLSEVAGCALHDGFRGQIVIKCVQRDLSLIQTLEIDRPPSLPDMVSAASFEQKFGLGAGFHFRREVCAVFPQRQHQNCNFARGCDGGLAEPFPAREADRPRFQS